MAIIEHIWRQMSVLWKNLSAHCMFEVCEGEDIAQARAVGVNTVVRDDWATKTLAEMKIQARL